MAGLNKTKKSSEFHHCLKTCFVWIPKLVLNSTKGLSGKDNVGMNSSWNCFEIGNFARSKRIVEAPASAWIDYPFIALCLPSSGTMAKRPPSGERGQNRDGDSGEAMLLILLSSWQGVRLPAKLSYSFCEGKLIRCCVIETRSSWYSLITDNVRHWRIYLIHFCRIRSFFTVAEPRLSEERFTETDAKH